MTMMPSTPPTNAFSDVMGGLETRRSGECIDLYSGGILECLRVRREMNWGFPISQVFEPAVLKELCLVARLDIKEVLSLSVGGPTTRKIRHEYEDFEESTAQDNFKLAGLLVATSRFSMAESVIRAMLRRDLSSELSFEFHLLDFIVRNRTGARGVANCFRAMRTELETGVIAPGRALNACAQAVVWHLKAKLLSEDDFTFYVDYGRRCAESQSPDLNAGVLSSWYRGVAMIPAGRRDGRGTRQMMQRARELGEAVLEASSSKYYDKHLMKTYYESSLKEFMYVTRDFDSAEAVAKDLIALDPVWGPSWGEAGEMYEAFGALDDAMAAFKRAVELGCPWHTYHCARYARLAGRMGRAEEVLTTVKYLLDLCSDEIPADLVEVGLVAAEAMACQDLTKRLHAAKTTGIAS